MKEISRIAILGAGNIGTAIARGLVLDGRFSPENIILTRRRFELLNEMREKGFVTQAENAGAVSRSDIVIIAVEPRQIDGVLGEIAPVLMPEKHVVISVVTGVSTGQITKRLGKRLDIIRAMPNTAIAVGESMTCLASNGVNSAHAEMAESVFSPVGRVIWINEEEMTAATALGACGIAFFMRAIRAASQGGIEVGFHSETALTIAAQTAKGAASLLLSMGNHPEREIDKVTTPRGCTIAGLNRMEHEGFSSAMIRGITVSAGIAAGLYDGGGEQ